MSLAENAPIDVFVSYNALDRSAAQLLARMLSDAGVRVWLDVSDLAGGQEWQHELERAIAEARSVAILLGNHGVTGWQKTEMQLALIQHRRRNCAIIPVLQPDSPHAPQLPMLLEPFQWVDFRGGFDPEGVQGLIRSILADRSATRPVSPVRPHQPPRQVSISKLPAAPKHFVGRDGELQRLDDAWDDEQTNLVCIVAFGGVGKSSLVAEWLQRLRKQNWRGADWVLGYSFYSQGERDDGVSSADSFINKALQDFGDPHPALGAARDRAERLAKCIRRQRTLLVLDGMEPLQWGPASGRAGQIKDQGLRTLIRELAAHNPGLCVVTTREAVTEITDCASIDLNQLSNEAGAALLSALGVKGTTEQLKTASAEVKGHGLALTLLGNYVRKAFQGDIRRLKYAELWNADQLMEGHAQKLMQTYERWLGAGRELSLLRLMGLFDRPATQDCLEALRQAPAIPDVTEALVDADDADWNLAISNLAECGLVTRVEGDGATAAIDAHPLIREYFALRLSEEFAVGASQAHRRVAEHLLRTAPERPQTFEELVPLFLAASHSLRAGDYAAALDIYSRRIQRGAEMFATTRLGAHGAALALLSQFFVGGNWGVPIWRRKPIPCDVPPDMGMLVLQQTSMCLRGARGFGTPELEQVHARWLELAQEQRDIRAIGHVLCAQWVHYLTRGLHAKAREVGDRCLQLANNQTPRRPTLLVECQLLQGFNAFMRGDLQKSRDWLELGLATYEEIQDPSACLVAGQDPRMACLGRYAQILWLQGDVARARELVEEVLRWEGLNGSPFTHAMTLCFAGMVAQFDGDLPRTQQLAEGAIKLSDNLNFLHWKIYGKMFLGWSLAVLGDPAGIELLQRTQDEWHDNGGGVLLPYYYALQADALMHHGRDSQAWEKLLLAEAAVRTHDERFWEAEVYRLQACCQQRLGGDAATIDGLLDRAIQTARAQGARSLEQRALRTRADFAAKL